MYSLAVIFILAAANCFAQKQLPAVLPQFIIKESNGGSCPAANVIERARNATMSEIHSILSDTVVPRLNIQSQCPCGGRGEWMRIAHLNMSHPSQQCPSNWNLIASQGVRGCGRSTGGGTCDFASFPSGGKSYSRVCGRVNAYQRGTPSAFEPSYSRGLEGAYIEGVSLTHGAAGSRQHIWSFANALDETVSRSDALRWYCPCMNPNITWPNIIPSFIGNNYFCASGNPGPSHSLSTIYADDLLWDGEGCSSTNTCCELNNPPWFCTTLPQPTTDDLEVRICHDQSASDEDALISIIDLFVM